MKYMKRSIHTIILSLITIASALIPALLTGQWWCMISLLIGGVGIILVVFTEELCAWHNSWHNFWHTNGDSDTTPSDFFVVISRASGYVLYLMQFVPLIISCALYGTI